MGKTTSGNHEPANKDTEIRCKLAITRIGWVCGKDLAILLERLMFILFMVA